MPEKGKLTEIEINELLLETPVGHLALAMDNRPYVIPLNYAFYDGEIYFHCALEGRKIEYIRANPRACFQVSVIGGLITSESPCKHNYSYRSVVVEGTVEEICGSESKETVLRKIVAKYADPGVAEAPISPRRIESVGVYRIIPDLISGKKDS